MILRAALIALALAIAPAVAGAQQAKVVSSCGAEVYSTAIGPVSLEVDTTGKLCTSSSGGGGGGGTSSNFGAAFPTAGTAIGITDGTNMQPITGTNFTGTSYSADVSQIVGSGVVSATNGSYTNLLQGNAVVSSANPIFAQLTAGSASIGTLSANQSVNVNQLAGNSVATGNGTGTTGTLRVAITSDGTGQVKLAGGSNTIGALTANQSVNLAQVNGTTTTTGAGAAGAGSQNVAVAQDATTTAGANPGRTYNTIAASQSTQALTGGSGGATGDYLGFCVVTPTSTSPGVVTIFDNSTQISSFAGGSSSLSNLVPFTIPVGAVSVNGAWKITTGASLAVVCTGKFT